MPRGNRTGPMGMGPRTGRAAGFCAGYSVPGCANPVSGGGAFGRGAWSGRGGRGYRHWYYATGLTGWQRSTLDRSPAQAGLDSQHQQNAREIWRASLPVSRFE